MEITKAIELLQDITRSGIPPLDTDVTDALRMGVAALTGVKKLHDSPASDYFRDIYDDTILAGMLRSNGRPPV